MSIPAPLDRTPPRHDIDAFLAPVRARFRKQLTMLGLLFALPVLIGVAAVLANPGSGIALAALAGMVVCVGGPVALYLRQDLVVGRRLLVDGRVVAGTVTGSGRYPSGQATLTVDFAAGEERRELRFRVPIAEDEAARCVGKSIPVLHLADDPRAVGIVLEGVGIVTTR